MIAYSNTSDKINLLNKSVEQYHPSYPPTPTPSHTRSGHTLDLDEGLSSLIASVTLFLFVNLYRSPFSLVGELCSSNNIHVSIFIYQLCRSSPVVWPRVLWNERFYGMRVNPFPVLIKIIKFRINTSFCLKIHKNPYLMNRTLKSLETISYR